MNTRTRFIHKGCFLTIGFLALLLVQQAQAIDILVTTNGDGGNGSLRQAIQFNESLGGGNRIVFSNTVAGSITLTNPLGELVITRDVTIIGPGANVLAISGNSAHRVFHLSAATVNVSGLTVANGNDFSGGGILQDSGTLQMSQCIISNNVAAFWAGGIQASGSLTLAECTIVRNRCSATDGYGGGGVFQMAGLLTLMNCTFLQNTNTDEFGGGLDVFSSAAAVINNCSFALNRASFGGALVNYGTVAITNCTLSGNSSGYGGGILNSGTVTVRNSIIAGNAGTDPDCEGTFISAGFNLIGVYNGSTGWGALGDQLGTTNGPLNPLLGPLQDNGGLTPTLAPMPGSPAIDQGNDSGVIADQRGQPRPFTNSFVSSIPLGGNRGDIGAVEFHPGDNKIIVVNNSDAGVGSLRYAIQVATNNVNVTFDSGVTGTIALTTGELLVNKALTIIGPTNSRVVVSGNNLSRVFHITGGPVNMSSLTIANASGSGDGGGFYCDFGGALVLSNCAVSGNTTVNNGGAIANNGSVAAYNCTFSGNHAFYAGAIYTYAGPVLLRNCTVVSNTASGAAGGLFNYSLAAGTSNNLSGTLVANNSAANHADVLGVFTSGGYNLIGKMDYSIGAGNAAGVPTSGLTNNVNHDQVGSLASPIDPLIGALQDNGGQTFTHAVKPGSPAIDKCISNGLSTDQRGAPRPFDYASVGNAAGGDGSDIGAFESGTPQLRIQAGGTNAIFSWPAYYGGFALEFVTNLPASNNWVGVAGVATVVGDQYNVTCGTAGGNKFFRLRGY